MAITPSTGKTIELSTQNALAYLRDAGFPVSTRARVRALGGGVSNVVVLVEDNSARFVLKQALGKLRVQHEWLSDRRRILREAWGMRLANTFWPPGAVPEVLHEDPKNFLIVMTAAPPEAVPWKSLLLQGKAPEHVAKKAGQLLGLLFQKTWQDPVLQAKLGDLKIFDELRLDPYYRFTAQQHPDVAEVLMDLVNEYPRRCCALVHGDWSPKNLLVSCSGVTAIDFEVIHFGDPGFDVAFLWNHLLLKSFFRPEDRAGYHRAAREFWNALVEVVPSKAELILRSALRHLGGLLLARIDGKSPVEYITEDSLKQQIRRFAKDLLLRPPQEPDEVWRRMSDA